jgi:hypothetical protein
MRLRRLVIRRLQRKQCNGHGHVGVLRKLLHEQLELLTRLSLTFAGHEEARVVKAGVLRLGMFVQELRQIGERLVV